MSLHPAIPRRVALEQSPLPLEPDNHEDAAGSELPSRPNGDSRSAAQSINARLLLFLLGGSLHITSADHSAWLRYRALVQQQLTQIDRQCAVGLMAQIDRGSRITFAVPRGKLDGHRSERDRVVVGHHTRIPQTKHAVLIQTAVQLPEGGAGLG